MTSELLSCRSVQSFTPHRTLASTHIIEPVARSCSAPLETAPARLLSLEIDQPSRSGRPAVLHCYHMASLLEKKETYFYAD